MNSTNAYYIRRGTRAVGIEYVQNPRFHPTATSIGALTAHARKLVVLSAGAFGSPVILERSGIGAKKVLEKYGVKQLVDLPGVGENYQGIISVVSQKSYTSADFMIHYAQIIK